MTQKQNRKQATSNKQQATRIKNKFSLSPVASRLSPAFTLIEILVAMTILLLLLSAASVYWRNAVVKRRDTQRKADLRAIQFAAEAYFQQNGKYPGFDPPMTVLSCSDNTNWEDKNASPAGLAYYLVSDYIEKLPKDPVNVNNGILGADASKTFLYCYMPYLGGKYMLMTRLENQNDPVIFTGQDLVLSGDHFYNYRFFSGDSN